MSGEEEGAKYYLSYKDHTGAEVCEPLIVGSTPRKDIEDRIAFLQRRGYTNIVLVDKDKKPIDLPE